MKRTVVCALLLTVASIALGAERALGPADYLAIITGSKLHYNMTSTLSKTPLPVLQCARRDESKRVVIDANGAASLVEWKVKLEALKLAHEGETLYQAEKFKEAAAKYRQALETDPEFASGYFFLGDALLFDDDAAGALEQYRKGIALDPTIPTGHFFASSALVELGKPEEAREEVVQALLYHPPYPAVWKTLDSAPRRLNVKPVVRHKFEPPAGIVGVAGKKGIDIAIGPDPKWLGYAMCKAAWANEPQFQAAHRADAWSLNEEHACVINQMVGAYNTAEARLTRELKKQGKPANLRPEEVRAALPPLEQHLFEVADAGLLDGYILFEIIGQNCPAAMSTTPKATLRLAEEYLKRFVLVAAE